MPPPLLCFFFNDTATTEIYTLSLHDALPISPGGAKDRAQLRVAPSLQRTGDVDAGQMGVSLVCRLGPCLPLSSARSGRSDRKSTRLNSSHQIISYAVFCLKKKKKRYRRMNSI